MRLTLRTLLAYIDGILDPEDQEELAKQVEGSDNAKELLHRTGDTMRRIRLGSPPVDSPTHDANAVAEYLDNTMSPEEVMEFERRCLESDPELAEAASAHHILTMVLGQRADVDDDLKRVMYGLPAQHAAAQRAEPVVQRPVATSGPIEEVPDYLRASQGSMVWRVAPAVATLLLLGVAAWVFMPGGWYDQVTKPVEVAANNQDEPSSDESKEAPIASPESVTPEATDDGSEAVDETPSVVPPTEPDETLSTVPSAEPPAIELPTEPAAPVSQPEEASPPAVADRAAMASADAGTPLVEPPPTLPATDAPDSTDGDPLAMTDDTPPALGEDDSVAPAIAETPPEPAGPVVVGMVTTVREVLLRYSDELGDWERPPRTEGELPNVSTGDRLLSLPSYRPQVRLQSIDVVLSGATQIDVMPSMEADDRAKVKLGFGRLVFANTGSEEASIELVVGGIEGVAKLSRGAVIAVEAERPFKAGIDPTSEASTLLARYYAPRGGVTWIGPAGEVTATERSAWAQVGDEVGPIAPDRVDIDWLEGEGLSTLQRRAAAELERQLDAGEPIWPQLAELYDARRVEEQVQVAISSMYVGHYDPFIEALSDQGQKQYWEREVDAIRATMSRSPELANAVRDALIDKRGDVYAADLYRMLCGFSPEEIGRDREAQQKGVLVELIDWLESDQLDFRVLANYNLEQITNRRVYNPIASPDARRRTVAVFRDRLADGELIREER